MYNLTEKFTEKFTDNLTDNQKEILKLIEMDSKITQDKLSKELNVSRQAIAKNIKQLKELNIVERKGSDRKGYWKIIIK